MIRALLAGLMAAFTVAIAGCTGSTGPAVTLAEANGVVKYQNAPVAGATVTFVPEVGPLATGITDLEGKFTLASGAMKGVAVGPATVSITAYAPGSGSSSSSAPSAGFSTAGGPPDPAEAKAKMDAMMKMQKDRATSGAAAEDKPKNAIPDKYATASTSGLKVTVDSDAAKNTFNFDLK